MIMESTYSAGAGGNSVRNGESTLSVNLNRELARKTRQKGLVPLTSYVNEVGNDKWSQREFPREKHNISINASFSSEFKNVDINEKFYVSLTLLGNFWFVFKKQLKGRCLFNGVNSYQDILMANSTTYLEFESTRMLISNRQATGFDAQKELMRGQPQHSEYGMKTPQGLFRYPHNKTVLIGANPVCDILIKGAPFAALVAVCKGSLFINNFGFEDVTINGEAMSAGTAPLRDGDQITVGVYNFTANFPDVCVDTFIQRVPEGTLCMVPIKAEGGAIEKIYLQFGSSMIFGRGSDCDCIVDIDGISRKHAQVIVYDNHVLVLDCYSTNGTFINNAQVSKRRAYPGDIISMGNMNFLLCYYNN